MCVKFWNVPVILTLSKTILTLKNCHFAKVDMHIFVYLRWINNESCFICTVPKTSIIKTHFSIDSSNKSRVLFFRRPSLGTNPTLRASKWLDLIQANIHILKQTWLDSTKSTDFARTNRISKVKRLAILYFWINAWIINWPTLRLLTNTTFCKFSKVIQKWKST